MKRLSFLALVTLVFVLGTGAGFSWAQRTCVPTPNNCPDQDVTFSRIQIGGEGSLSSNGPSFSNPGRLDDGTIAEADLEFTFDRTTGRLTIVARNQTTSTATLTGFSFNTTPDVTGMSLVSETGSLTWELAFDRDRTDNVVNTHPTLNYLRLDGFGRFSAFLANKGIDTGGAGGDPREILAGQNVTFVIQVAGNIGGITACSFTSQPSLIPPGDKIVTAVGRFQAGQQGGSGFLGPCTEGPLLVTLASVSVRPYDSAVEIAWETAAEVENAGFAILRRDVRTKQVVRLNQSLVPSQGSEVSGARYSLTDRSAVNGKKYEYMVEDWDIYGVNTIHAPEVAVPNPKRPPIRLLAPAYEAAAVAGTRLRWESDERAPAVLEISAEATFPSGATLRLPAGVRTWRVLGRAEIEQIDRMVSEGEGGVYWRVTSRAPKGPQLRSETFYLVVDR